MKGYLNSTGCLNSALKDGVNDEHSRAILAAGPKLLSPGSRGAGGVFFLLTGARFVLLGLIVAALMIPQQGFSQFVKPTPEKPGSLPEYKDLMHAYDQWISDPANIETRGWKAYGRFIEMNRSRLNPDGNPADRDIFINEIIKVNAEKQEMMKMKSGTGWSPVGPIQKPPSTSGSFSHGMGRVNCIAFHPTDPDIYWIGVAQGGVWKTTDGGDSYIPLTDDLPILRISDIAVNPLNPDNIFISVCDYAYIGVALDTDSRKRHTHYGIGIYKTYDGGITWSPTGLGFDQSDLDKTLIRRVLFHPTQPGVLLAGGVSGVFKSVDDGENWVRVLNEIIWDIEQDFYNGNTIYSTTGTIRNYGGRPATMIKSTDFGDSWTQLNTGWPTDYSIGRTEIGLTPESSDYIYVVAANPGGTFYGFYRSTDGGTTWQARNTMAANGVNILDGSQGWYDLAILVDPRNKERVFVGGINFQVSVDGGANWTQSSFWVMTEDDFTVHADQHQFKYNFTDGKYYACHDGGVARTSEVIAGRGTDGRWATRWEERSNGMIITSFYRIGLCQMFPGYVVGGAQDNSTFYNKNGNWINFIGGDGMDCMINPDNPDIVYGSSQYGNLVRSDDGGSSYRSIRPPVGSEKGEWTTPMIQDMNNPNIIFAGYGNVWRSENKGGNWTKISNFPVVQGYGSPAEINALALYPANNSVIYAAQRIRYDKPVPSRLWVTHDGGVRWYNVTQGLPDSLYFTSLAVNGNDSLDVWVSCGGFLPGQKIYRSRDGGITWLNMSEGIPNIPVNSVVHQEGFGDDVVYIGTDAGVYYHTGENGQWTLYSNNLPNVIISELEIHHISHKLYASTFGRGIWMTDLLKGASAVNDNPLSGCRLSVFPNPAKEQVNISLSGMQPGEVTLEIIDIAGRQVHAEKLQISNDQTTKSVEPDLKEGLYFLRIWSGQNHLTEKFIVKR